MKALRLIRVEVEGQVYLDNSAGRLVIANHPSLIDVVLLITLLPDACCVVKAELWQSPLLRGVVKAMGYISNSSAEELLNGSEREFAAGSVILVFPEGTRTMPGQPVRELKFQRGAANMAARCGVDLVPVFIRCDPPTLRKGEAWYEVPASRAQFRLVARPPIRLRELDLDLASPAKASRELNRFLEFYFTEGLKQYG